MCESLVDAINEGTNKTKEAFTWPHLGKCILNTHKDSAPCTENKKLVLNPPTEYQKLPVRNLTICEPNLTASHVKNQIIKHLAVMHCS